MHIYLQKEARPITHLTAWQIPVHLAKLANTEISKALKAGIIVPELRPAPWISPAFFVQETNGGASLVTDYTFLNKYVH